VQSASRARGEELFPSLALFSSLFTQNTQKTTPVLQAREEEEGVGKEKIIMTSKISTTQDFVNQNNFWQTSVTY